MAKSRYGKKGTGHRKLWPADPFESFTIQVPKHKLPELRERAAVLGISLERLLSHLIGEENSYYIPWKIDSAYQSNFEVCAKVLKYVGRVRKGVSLDHLLMLDDELNLIGLDILAAVRDLVITGDLEYFDIPGQTIKGVRLSKHHKTPHDSTLFRKFAGVSQRSRR